MSDAPPEVPAQYRAAGALMLASGVMNLMVALVWFLSLIWVCVGVYWILPMSVAIGEIVVGLLALLGVPMRFARVAAGIGGLNGMLLLNPYSLTLQGVAVVLQLVPPVADWLQADR